VNRAFIFGFIDELEKVGGKAIEAYKSQMRPRHRAAYELGRTVPKAQKMVEANTPAIKKKGLSGDLRKELRRRAGWRGKHPAIRNPGRFLLSL
jgi:hypothetical protein